MQELSDEDIEALARKLSARGVKPKRRESPRLAAQLRDVPRRDIPTSAGAVAAWRLGAGPATLLVHGWEDDHVVWARLIDALRARGRAIVTLDLPGHGLSEADDPSISIWGEALCAVADALGPIDAAVAHSMGVSGVLTALDRGLKLETFVSIAPPLPTRPDLIQPRTPNPKLPPAVQTRLLALNDERRAKRAAEFPIDPEKVAQRQSARALFVHCRNDELWRVDASMRLAAAWPGAQTLFTEGLGHRAITRSPDIIEQVVAFIEART